MHTHDGVHHTHELMYMIGHWNSCSHLWKFATWRFGCRGLTVLSFLFCGKGISDLEGFSDLPVVILLESVIWKWQPAYIYILSIVCTYDGVPRLCPYMHAHAQLISISSTSRNTCSYGNLGPILTRWISMWGCGPSNSMIRIFSNWCTFIALFSSLIVTQNWENFHRGESCFFFNPSFFFLHVLARSQCSIDLFLMSKDIFLLLFNQ